MKSKNKRLSRVFYYSLPSQQYVQSLSSSISPLSTDFIFFDSLSLGEISSGLKIKLKNLSNVLFILLPYYMPQNGQTALTQCLPVNYCSHSKYHTKLIYY